jgi:hypothetical protein
MFYFWLCETLGFATPRHLLSAITSAEVTEWRAYYEVKQERREDEERRRRMEAEAAAMAHKAARGG